MWKFLKKENFYVVHRRKQYTTYAVISLWKVHSEHLPDQDITIFNFAILLHVMMLLFSKELYRNLNIPYNLNNFTEGRKGKWRIIIVFNTNLIQINIHIPISLNWWSTGWVFPYVNISQYYEFCFRHYVSSKHIKHKK